MPDKKQGNKTATELAIEKKVEEAEALREKLSPKPTPD